MDVNFIRYQDSFFELYHELANLHVAQKNDAERRRVDHCVELLHKMDRAIKRKINQK